MVPAKRKLVSPRLGCVAVCIALLTPVFGSAEKSVRVESVEKAALLPLSAGLSPASCRPSRLLILRSFTDLLV